MNYILHIVLMCEIYLILALAMNLLAGYSGLLSMSQAAYYGLGAYFTALVLTNFVLPFPVVVVGAVVFNLIAAIPIAIFSLRLRGLYFALATLSWQVVVFSVLYNWISLTEGPYGITGIPRPEILGIPFISLHHFAILGGVTTILVVFFFYFLHCTPLSRNFGGVRDDQLAIMSFGKSPAYYKTIAILIASGISAIAGALFATYHSYVDPTSFTLDESILIISIVLIGGLGSIKGSVAGALFYVLLPEILRFVDIPDAMAANMRMMIYALVLILVLIYRPHGFFGKYRFEK